MFARTEKPKFSKVKAVSVSGGVVLGVGLVGFYYTQIATIAAVDKIIELDKLHHANDLAVVDSKGATFNYHHEIHRRHGTIPEQSTTCFASRQVLGGRATPGLFKLSNPNTGTQEVVIDANPLEASLQCFATTLAKAADFLSAERQTFLNMQLQAVVNKQSEGLTAEGKLKLAIMINNAHVYSRKGNPQSYGNFKPGSGYVELNRPSMFGSASVNFYSGHNYTETQLQQGANNFIKTLIDQLSPRMRLIDPKPAATAPGLLRR